MIKKCEFISCLILIFILGSSNTLLPESDVLGWGKVKWGMTHSQVSKIYNLENWCGDCDPPRCKLKGKVNIQGREFQVTFWFDKKSSLGKLIGVFLLSTAHKVPENHYDMVRDSIISKYGQPQSSKREEIPIRSIRNEIIWLKESGRIRFEYFYIWYSEKETFGMMVSILYEGFMDKDKL